MSFASGKNALMVCDMCGYAYRYTERKKSSYGTVQCPTCFDGQYDMKNHPQLQPPPLSDDPQALEDARPDVPLAEEAPSYTSIYSEIFNFRGQG